MDPEPSTSGADDERIPASTDADPLAAIDDPRRYRHLIEHIQDAVVEFDVQQGEPIVTTVNPAFESVFGYEADEIVGSSLNDYIVPPWLESEARQLDARTNAGEINYQRVYRETTAGLREFLYRGIPYETEGGRQCGFAVYTDLTEDRRNESRIEVLHRLLRHNLRNRLEVLLGNLDLLEKRIAEGPDGHADLLSQARDSADDLARLAREAHEIHRTLDAPVPDDASINCAALTARLVEDLRAEYPHADIDLTTTDGTTAAATDRLGSAIEELVTNAVVHNPDPEPSVRVTVAPAPEPGWTDVVVADDGPLIPESERAVINDDADISPLQHGTGLGLWLVRWTVERFGGTVSLELREAGGNEIRIRVPR
jgi:PAS domain S-box-containing protein